VNALHSGIVLSMVLHFLVIAAIVGDS